jgi:hypothetical protein
MEEKGMAPVGAYLLAYTQMGSGSPVVVLEAAGGAMRRSWHEVMPAIAGFTRLTPFCSAWVFDPAETRPEVSLALLSD